MRSVHLIVALVALPAFAQLGDYMGPSVMSRGSAASASPADGLSFRPYININAMYNSRLVTVTPGGGVAQAEGGFGGEGAIGLYGYKGTKRTVVGLNYRGDYRRYDKQSAYDGSNQFLTFGVTHQPSRHVTISLRAGAGTYTRQFSYLGTFGFYDPTFAQIPQDELLDSRTNYLSTMADVTYHKSARLSFNAGATGFVINRQRSSLYGVVGGTARGDATYRLTRRTTVGADYFYTHFGYNKAFGSGDMHSAAGNYSVAVARRTELRFRVGMLRVETLALAMVAIDPEIAALIGRGYGVAAFHKIYTQPTYSGQIVQRFRLGSVAAGYSHGATPGNGIYLTSRQNSANASWSYTGMRRWSLSGGLTYSDMKSVGQEIGTYRRVGGGTGLTRSIARSNLYLTARSDVQHTVAGPGFLRNYFTATVGLAFAPGDVPLRLW